MKVKSVSLFELFSPRCNVYRLVEICTPKESLPFKNSCLTVLVEFLSASEDKIYISIQMGIENLFFQTNQVNGMEGIFSKCITC